MRLTIVSNGDFYSTYGGGQVYVKNLVDELIARQKSHQLDLSVVSVHNRFSTALVCSDYKGVPLYEVSPLSNYVELLSKINPDIVHIHGEKARMVDTCAALRIPCVVTAHHGGICCPAGALLNHKDQICHQPADLYRCLPCYLRNIRTGLFWYPIVKHLPIKSFVKIGALLKKIPFVPILTPVGESMYAIQEKKKQWDTVRLHASHIIAPSNAIAESMILNGCDKGKISVVPHGISLPIRERKSATNAAITPVSDSLSTIHFYYVGRICYVKGVHVMLEAFTSLPNRNIMLHLIGGTGNKEEVRYQKRLLEHYRSDKQIVWHGKVEPPKVHEMVSAYHCLLHPTICMEIFGLNIAEAQSQGKYIIATRCGGSEMQIHSEKEGMLVAPNNVSEIRDAMQRYLDNPIPSNAKVNTIENHSAQLLSVYGNLIDKKGE